MIATQRACRWRIANRPQRRLNKPVTAVQPGPNLCRLDCPAVIDHGSARLRDSREEKPAAGASRSRSSGSQQSLKPARPFVIRRPRSTERPTGPRRLYNPQGGVEQHARIVRVAPARTADCLCMFSSGLLANHPFGLRRFHDSVRLTSEPRPPVSQCRCHSNDQCRPLLSATRGAAWADDCARPRGRRSEVAQNRMRRPSRIGNDQRELSSLISRRPSSTSQSTSDSPPRNRN